MPGPIPKHSSERRRRNKESGVETVAAPGAPIEQPEADPAWNPIAAAWYNSLAESGQAKFFEPSDWYAARYVAESMSRNLDGDKFSAVLFASVWSAMNDLLTTEGARRRVRMEIEREPLGPRASVTAIDGYRKRVGAGS